MQTTLDVLLTKKFLISTLTACAVINLISNIAGEKFAIIAGNLMYIPVAGSLLVLSLMILVRFGTTGHHGTAWISFGGYAISVFIAEMLWIVQEFFLNEKPFPSSADIFYLISYPFLLMFFIAYFQPVKHAITRKMFVVSFAFSIGILIPSLYFAVDSDTNNDSFAEVLGMIYPILDSMILIPALIGMSLFFKGRVNFTWTLFCLGVLSVFIADTAFLFGQNQNVYYTGNPMEIPFYWNYILLSFGVYSQLALFKKDKTDKKLENLK
jgi:hypothetical protein